MSGVSTLENFRQRMERGTNEYTAKGSALHAAIQGPVTNLNTLCDGMATTAGRYLRHLKCEVAREVMPYDMANDSVMVRHRFSRGDVQTVVDVTFFNDRVIYGGHTYPLAEIGKAEDAVADTVLSFYLPR